MCGVVLQWAFSKLSITKSIRAKIVRWQSDLKNTKGEQIGVSFAERWVVGDFMQALEDLFISIIICLKMILKSIFNPVDLALYELPLSNFTTVEECVACAGSIKV